MSGLVPVLIAVVLTEFGPRAELYARARRFDVSLSAIILCVIAAAVAGGLFAPRLTEWADAFLIAIALAFAAMGQVQRVRRADGHMAAVVAFWCGGVPLVAFAFATRFGMLEVSIGSVAGLFAAALLTRIANAAGAPLTSIRWVAAALLAIAAAIVAVGALRLV